MGDNERMTVAGLWSATSSTVENCGGEIREGRRDKSVICGGQGDVDLDYAFL